MKNQIIELNDEQIVETFTAAQAVNAGYSLGQIARCNVNGWEGQFRYSKNGNSGALAVGQCVRMLDWTTANFRSTASVYSAAGSKGFAELTLDQAAVAATVTRNQYAGLPVVLTVGTGIGQRNLIVGNEPAVAATDKLKLYLAKPYATTPATTTDIQIITADLVDKTTAVLDILGGVCVSAPATGSYFWRQVKGLAYMLVHGAGTMTGTTAQPYGMSTTAGAAEILASETPAQACPSPALGISKIGAGDTYAWAWINTVFAA